MALHVVGGTGHQQVGVRGPSRQCHAHGIGVVVPERCVGHVVALGR